MTEYLFSNQAQGTLNAAIGASDVTLNLQTGEGAEFPSPGAGQACRVLVYDSSNSEWMTCTGVSGDALTVTRDASVNYSFASGSYVELRLDATALNNMRQEGTERTVTSNPDGALAANYFGEEVYQSVTGVWWKHCTGTTWKAMNS
jgi:hypothetical protein